MASRYGLLSLGWNGIVSGLTDLTLVAGAVAAKGKPGLKRLGRNYVMRRDNYTIS